MRPPTRRRTTTTGTILRHPPRGLAPALTLALTLALVWLTPAGPAGCGDGGGDDSRASDSASSSGRVGSERENTREHPVRARAAAEFPDGVPSGWADEDVVRVGDRWRPLITSMHRLARRIAGSGLPPDPRAGALQRGQDAEGMIDRLGLNHAEWTRQFAPYGLRLVTLSRYFFPHDFELEAHMVGVRGQAPAGRVVLRWSSTRSTWTLPATMAEVASRSRDSERAAFDWWRWLEAVGTLRRTEIALRSYMLRIPDDAPTHVAVGMPAPALWQLIGLRGMAGELTTFTQDRFVLARFEPTRVAFTLRASTTGAPPMPVTGSPTSASPPFGWWTRPPRTLPRDPAPDAVVEGGNPNDADAGTNANDPAPDPAPPADQSDAGPDRAEEEPAAQPPSRVDAGAERRAFFDIELTIRGEGEARIAWPEDAPALDLGTLRDDLAATLNDGPAGERIPRTLDRASAAVWVVARLEIEAFKETTFMGTELARRVRIHGTVTAYDRRGQVTSKDWVFDSPERDGSGREMEVGSWDSLWEEIGDQVARLVGPRIRSWVAARD